MCKSKRENRVAILLVSAFIASGALISCASSSSPAMVKQEEGYYYGYGTGETSEAAASAAKADLLANALTATARKDNSRAKSIKVTEAAAVARLADIKPFAENEKDQAPAITYRVKIEDWDKEEVKYAASLREKLDPKVSSLSSKSNTVDKINGILEVLSILSDEGEYTLLTKEEGSSELYSESLESTLKDASKGFKFELGNDDGFVTANTKFSVKVKDAAGKALVGLPLTVKWNVAALPSTAENAEPDEIVSTVKTDSTGSISVSFPESADYHNRPVTLTVSTTFAATVPSSSVMKKLDSVSAVDGNYVEYDDFDKVFETVTVPAGKFNFGMVSHDTQAGKGREASRVVELASYAMALTPVTNAQYAAYLHITRAEEAPAYFDNPSYNAGNQPVVAVTLEDAQKFADWLSSETGKKFRLPTEEEWEKAARAGKEVIYPWGDTAPNKDSNANYKGNGKFKATSPVGAFENGANEWGLIDMAGNVAEWTTSTRSENAESETRVVKGGSYMDGPKDLRISNFREVNSKKALSDVGFRLVMEVSK